VGDGVGAATVGVEWDRPVTPFQPDDTSVVQVRADGPVLVGVTPPPILSLLARVTSVLPACTPPIVTLTLVPEELSAWTDWITAAI